MKINSISFSTPVYPKRLQDIPKPPDELFFIGNQDLLSAPVSVAIVGTRKPTAYGRIVTETLAKGLARRGACIVSGLALGVDGIAQKSAIEVGGQSIAVLASGLDSISPRSHRELAISILEKNGTLVSENPPGTPPLKWEFLKRNRLISGLADSVVVTEAAAKSGSMSTVMHALQQGKDVYVVPGNITSPMSAGCNKLIEQGAQPIIDIEAFIEQIMPSKASDKQQMLLAQTPEEKTILDLMNSGIKDGEELHKMSKLDSSTYSMTMTMLELRGVIRPLGGNIWSL